MASAPLLDETSTVLTDLDPNPLMILGQDRRIVYGNPAAQQLAGLNGNEEIAGRRIGEVLHCIHSLEPQGCGSTPFCQFCGANIGIRAGLDARLHEGECRITAASDATNASVEYAIHTRPVVWKGEHAVFCSLRDVSNEKRRKVLEHTFFTDILRVAISLRSASEQSLLSKTGQACSGQD
jgi:PAS domain-containing protein